MTKYRLHSYLLLLTVALIWGAAAPVVKFTLQGIEPLPFLSYRFTVSAIISLVYFLTVGFKFKVIKKHLIFVVVYGLLATTIALGALFTGLNNSTVLDLVIIGAMGPLLVTVGGAMFFRDHITRREKIGISIVVIGVAINSIFPILKNDGLRLTGNIFLFAYLLADGSSILVAKKMVKDKIPSIQLTNMAFIVGAATIIPITLMSVSPNQLISSVVSLPLKYHLGVWYMAIASGSIAYYFYVKAQKSIEVSEASLFNYLQPVFAVPLAVLWLGEKISTNFIIGAAFIITGLAIAEYKSKNKTNN